MAFCSTCGNNVSDTARYCVNCGEPLRSIPIDQTEKVPGTPVKQNSSFFGTIAMLHSKAGFAGILLVSVGLFGKWLSGFGPDATGIDILSRPENFVSGRNSFGGPVIIQVVLVVLIIALLIALRYKLGLGEKDSSYKFARSAIIITFVSSYVLLNKSGRMMAPDSLANITTNGPFRVYELGGWGIILSFVGCLALLFEYLIDKYSN